MASKIGQTIYAKAAHAPGTYQSISYKNNVAKPTHKNDIAIIELEQHIQFNSYVKPACLHPDTPVPGGNAYISGWGDVVEGK